MVLFDTSSFWGISTKVSGLSKHLPTTCPENLQMRKHVLETGSVLRKKSSGWPTKRRAGNTEEVEQTIPEINPRN
jgi:hypothetical protein